ncbi:MAG: GNAT family N-acetyltransferase [Ktedonobacterales bacterium]
MPTASSQPYTTDDLPTALHLLVAYRAADPAQLTRYPTVWRLWLLLSSRLGQPKHDARLWLDEQDTPVAFTALWSRHPADSYRALEWVIAPDADPALGDAIFTWAMARVEQLTQKLGAPLRLAAGACPGEDARIALIERHRLTRQADGNVYMTCPLANLPASALLPESYTICQLTGEADVAEVAAYQTLYEQVFAPVALAHRLELLRSPNYLHLAARAPEGQMVAFCELSYSRAEWAAYPARCVSWVDYVGTAEAQQRKGLGRALLLVGLQRLHALGSDTALLITMEANAGAQSVYTALGFTILEHDVSYSRELG